MSTTSAPPKHTPGPWEWLIHDHSMASLGVMPDPGMGTPHVLSISPCPACSERAEPREWKWGRCHTPSEADARLIAAAPDLLAALKQCLSVFEQLADAGNYPEPLYQKGGWEFAAKAIAKAEGR